MNSRSLDAPVDETPPEHDDAEEQAQALYPEARKLVRFWGVEEARRLAGDDAEAGRDAVKWLIETVLERGETTDRDEAHSMALDDLGLFLRLVAQAVEEAERDAEAEAMRERELNGFDLDFDLKEAVENAA